MSNRRRGDDVRHLDTDHLQDDLIRRSVRGGAVTLVAQGLKIVIQFGAIVVLARLLSPDDFGVFAMVAAFLVVLELLKDLGLSTATIQRQDLSHSQVSTLFWLNCGLGVVVAILTAALAPLLAWFYGEPILLRITPVVALSFLFTGVSAQHIALLRRQMRFTAAAATQLGSEAAGLVAAVIAAMAGLGFWALVIQRLAWAVVMAVSAWVLCSWRPGRPGRLAEVRELVAFGGNATGAMMVAGLAANLDKVLIGWYWGGVPLGLFERAQKLLQQPIQNLNIPLATVALPTLSRLIDQPEAYRKSYIGVVQRLTMLIAPLSALMIAAAGPVLTLVLGSQWVGSAPVLAWMGMAVVFTPLNYSLSWLYMSQNRTREMLRASLVNSALGVGALVIGVPFGIAGVAIAYTVSVVVFRSPALFWLAGRRGPVPIRDFYRILGVPSLATAAGAGAIWAIRASTVISSWTPTATVLVSTVLAFGSALVVYSIFPDSRRILGSLPQLPAYLSGRAVRA